MAVASIEALAMAGVDASMEHLDFEESTMAPPHLLAEEEGEEGEEISCKCRYPATYFGLWRQQPSEENRSGGSFSAT